MCQAKPYPRCADHASQLLVRARGEYRKNPTLENFQAVRLAQAIYDATPKGVAELRKLGYPALADVAIAKRDAMIREAQQQSRVILTTPEQRVAYDATSTGGRKRSMFQLTQKQWDAGGYRKGIGQVMRLLRSTLPASLAEWQQCYLDAHGPKLMKQAQRFYEDVRANAAPGSTASTITRQEALDIALFHAVDETWLGHEVELEGVEYAKRLHPDLDVELSDWQTDLNDRVDIIAYSKTTDPSGHRQLVRAWQVKPRSFDGANQHERAAVLRAHERFEAHTGVKVEFLYADDIRLYGLTA